MHLFELIGLNEEVYAQTFFAHKTINYIQVNLINGLDLHQRILNFYEKKLAFKIFYKNINKVEQ